MDNFQVKNGCGAIDRPIRSRILQDFCYKMSLCALPFIDDTDAFLISTELSGSFNEGNAPGLTLRIFRGEY
jgi:hypothetical protein